MTSRRSLSVFLTLSGVFFFVVRVKGEGSGPIVVLDMEPAVERQRLRSDLLRREGGSRGDTTVKVLYQVQHILGMDEKDQILSVNGRLALQWSDSSLTWNPESYSGLTAVRFSPEDVWLPELQAAYNVRPLKIYDKLRSPPVLVSSNGSVRWFPQVRFDIPCSADYRHYPFDSHRCSLQIVHEAADSRQVALSTEWQSPSETDPVQGTEWALREVVQRRHSSHQVDVSIRLQRTSHMYRYVCVIPTIVSMLTLLCGFWLLPSEPGRHVVGCANIVVLTMLLQHLAAAVPAGKVVPIIAQYSASCLCLSAIFVVLTVVSELLSTSRGVAPSSLVRLAHFSLDRYLCLFAFSHVSGQERIAEATASGSMATPPEELSRRKDWQLVAVLVDRVAFWCFAFIFVVLLAVLAAV